MEPTNKDDLETAQEVKTEETEAEETNEKQSVEKTESTKEVKAEESTQEAKAEETSKEVETEKSEETAEEAETTQEAEKSPEEIKQERVKKIKLGIVAAGGVFILLAVVYIAAMLGGRNKEIEEEKETVVVDIAKEVEITEAVEEPVITTEVVEEEMPEESMLGILQGNARYDECVYADGGSVIVRKADKYGAIDYEGKEIVPVKYTEIGQIPTKEGMFVLSTSKVENVTEEKEGTTYSYEEVTTTYTLFDSTGKELYKGNDKVVVSGETYILGIEDKEDYRKSRVEYHKLGTKGSPYLTLYVNDQFSLNGFMDGNTTVMGFTAVPTQDQDTNPTNLFAGIMNTSGKVTWFAKAPGLDAFEKEVKVWQEDNKLLQQSLKKSAKKNKADKETTEEEIEYDAEGNPIESSEVDEEKEVLLDEEGNPIEDTDDEEDTEEAGEVSEDETDEYEQSDDISGGPLFHMDEILNAPVGGYFVYKDMYDVEDPYHWYTDKGTWYADLDTAYLTFDAKKGFKVGNFNNGNIDVKGFVVDGETYYNFGAYMVLSFDDKDVLVDISKAKGMTSEDITDKIVVAIYDEINISANNCWMYKDGDKAGYLDLKGQPLKQVYEDATSFGNGYALVVKDTKAIIINENFDELEEVCEAKTVEMEGDIITISNGNDTRKYMFKETRNAPQGDCIPSAVAEDAKVSPKAEESTGKKKK